MNITNPILVLSDVGVHFGMKPIFEHVSYTLNRGEICCISGVSGCGKSTLLKAVMGLVPYSGYIEVCGQKLSPNTSSFIRRNISYVPQELALPCDTVREMLRMPFHLRANRSVKWDEVLLLEHWKMLGLDSALLDARTTEISGGQRQRMMLAVSGLLNKSLLLADEPTSALDVDTSHYVLDYFRFLANDFGLSILLVSHASLFYNSLPLLRLD